MLRSREEDLERQRQEKLVAELRECTFKPSLCAAEESQAYLRRAAAAGRLVDAEEYLRRKVRITMISSPVRCRNSGA